MTRNNLHMEDLNYTTREQSEKLMGLGVPVNTADCIRVNDTGLVFFIREGWTAKEYINHYNPLRASACWSLGQLMKIIDQCEINNSNNKEYPTTMMVAKKIGLSYVEYLVRTIERSQHLLDFSKFNKDV